jgi:hypothetical protein
MSDTESGSSPTGQEAESTSTSSFSTNGNDPGDIVLDSDLDSGESVVDGEAFLADLARAMQTTAAAEQARNAEGTEQRRQSYVDAIRAREAIEAEDLRELAKEDVKGIDDWSDGEIKRIKLERERRIAARREQLQVRLEEHRTVIAQEVKAVEAAVAAYRVDIEQYFRRLESETDPVEIAKQAGSRPRFPVLETIHPNEVPVTTKSRHVQSEDSAPVDPVDAERSATLAQAPWASGSPKGTVEKAADDTPASEGSTATDTPVSDDTATADSPENADTTTSEEPEGDGSTTTDAPAGDESAATDATEGSKEPVAAAADATVVIPRSTGAGSWLRWPNKSDSGH